MFVHQSMGGVPVHYINACRSALTSMCGFFPSRASGECRPAGADLVEGCVQRQEGQNAAAQVGRAASYSLWHLFNSGLCERQSDREDAHPAPGGGKGESSSRVDSLKGCSHVTFPRVDPIL